MTKISALTEQTQASLDGTELLVITDSLVSLSLKLSTLLNFYLDEIHASPVDHGNFTSASLSLTATAGATNIFWMDTAAGSIDLSALGDISLSIGQRAVIRKTTSDVNTVDYDWTPGGTGKTKAVTLSLDEHYADTGKEIILTWDGSGWVVNPRLT